MKTTLLKGALVPACHVCNLPAPCPRHGRRVVGEQPRLLDGDHACEKCGYHVCACVTECCPPRAIRPMPWWFLSRLSRELPKRVPLGWAVKHVDGLNDFDRRVYVANVYAEDPIGVAWTSSCEVAHETFHSPVGDEEFVGAFIERIVGQMRSLDDERQPTTSGLPKLPIGFPTKDQVSLLIPEVEGALPSVFAWRDEAGSAHYAAEVDLDGKTCRTKRSFSPSIDTIPNAWGVARLLAEGLREEARHAAVSASSSPPTSTRRTKSTSTSCASTTARARQSTPADRPPPGTN